jgi:hypothetical protein
MRIALANSKRILLLAALGASALSAACVADNGGIAASTPALGPTSTGTGAVEEGSATEAGGVSAEGLEEGDPEAKPATGMRIAAAATVPPPRRGSPVYRCDGGRSLTIENRRSAVTLLDPDGETMVLPASPPGQSTRYGQKPYALVIEGGEVLYVKPRQAPFACRR